MAETVKMVVVFIFDQDHRVLLIRKNRPPWQKGRLNGIGGHVETTDKNIYEAATRETLEESGLVIDPDELVWFCQGQGSLSSGENYEVYFFSAFGINIEDAHSRTDEKLEIHDSKNLPADTIYNLNWMIPLAKDNEVGFPITITDLVVR